jgi:hypothetical protein
MLSRAMGCLSVAVVLAACQPAAPITAPAATGSSPPPAAPAPSSPHALAVQRLVDAARENGETELSVVWNNLTLGGAEGARRFEALFNRMYGTNMRIVFTPGPPMPDMALRIGQEVAAGRKTTTDAFLGTETHIPTLIANQSLEEFDYTTLSPRVPRELLAPRGVAVEIVGNFPGITITPTWCPTPMSRRSSRTCCTPSGGGASPPPITPRSSSVWRSARSGTPSA